MLQDVVIPMIQQKEEESFALDQISEEFERNSHLDLDSPLTRARRPSGPSGISPPSPIDDDRYCFCVQTECHCSRPTHEALPPISALSSIRRH